MDAQFLPDGNARLKQSPEFQAKLQALRDHIRAQYAAELAQAGFFRRLIIRCRMAREFRDERRKLIPSSQSLYGSGFAASSTRAQTAAA